MPPRPKVSLQDNQSITSSILNREMQMMELTSIQEEDISASQPNTILNITDPDELMGSDVNMKSALGSDQPTSAQLKRVPFSFEGMGPNKVKKAKQSTMYEEEQKNPLPRQTPNTNDWVKHNLNQLFFTAAQMREPKSNQSFGKISSGMVGSGIKDEEQLRGLNTRYFAMLTQKMNSKCIKTISNTYDIRKWPLMLEMVKLQVTMSSKTPEHDPIQFPIKLESTVVQLSIRGCKYCAGFGHGESKCWTAYKIKTHFSGNTVMHALLKKSLDEVTPDGEVTEVNTWPLEISFSYMCTKYLNQTQLKKNGNKKAQSLNAQISLHSGDLQQYFSNLKLTRCYVCFGFGHVARNKEVNIYKESTEQKEISLYENYRKCQTFAAIDRALVVDPAGKQTWKLLVKSFKKVQHGDTILDYEIVETASFQCPNSETSLLGQVLLFDIIAMSAVNHFPLLLHDNSILKEKEGTELISEYDTLVLLNNIKMQMFDSIMNSVQIVGTQDLSKKFTQPKTGQEEADINYSRQEEWAFIGSITYTIAEKVITVAANNEYNRYISSFTVENSLSLVQAAVGDFVSNTLKLQSKKSEVCKSASKISKSLVKKAWDMALGIPCTITLLQMCQNLFPNAQKGGPQVIIRDPDDEEMDE